MDETSHYWCERCEVVGKGPVCWSLGCTDLVRRGPKVDMIVFGLLDGNAETVTFTNV